MTERIPLAVPDLRGREAEYLERCLRDNWVSSAGPEVGAFESHLASHCGRSHGVATVNGTMALQLALLAAGIGDGDLVALPDWTFAGTANAVIHTGATPLFVDITRESWTLDSELLDSALQKHGTRVKAVVPVHALGHPADMDAIKTVCRRAGVNIVIEDAAGAIGATYRGRPVGGLGSAAMFSFNGNKTVTAGGGGMIVTDDETLATTARHLSSQARIGREYRYDAVGFNARMTNLNAALGIAQLERLDEMVAAKRAIAIRYNQAIAGRGDLEPMPRADWAESGCWLYSCATASLTDAEALVGHMEAQDIEARMFWLPLSVQPPYTGAPAVLSGVARELGGRVVSLPCGSALSETDQGRVIEALTAWHGNKLPVAA